MVIYLGAAEKVLVADSFSKGKGLEKQKNRKTGRKWFTFLFSWRFCLSILIILILFYGYLANRVVVLGHKMEQIERENENLQKRNSEMKVRVSWLSSVNNLEEEAKKFQMVVPKTVCYLDFYKKVVLK